MDFSPLIGEPALVSVPLVSESDIATSAEQPVTVGIPWPRGVLTEDLVLSLADPSARPAPLQSTPVAHWSDGSVKWLLLDFICRLGRWQARATGL